MLYHDENRTEYRRLVSNPKRESGRGASTQSFIKQILQETIHYMLFVLHLVPLTLQQCRLLLRKPKGVSSNQLVRIRKLLGDIEGVVDALAQWAENSPRHHYMPVLLFLGTGPLQSSRVYCIEMSSLLTTLESYTESCHLTETLKRQLMRSFMRLWESNLPCEPLKAQPSTHSSSSVLVLVPIIKTEGSQSPRCVPTSFSPYPHFSLSNDSGSIKEKCLRKDAEIYSILLSRRASLSPPLSAPPQQTAYPVQRSVYQCAGNADEGCYRLLADTTTERKLPLTPDWAVVPPSDNDISTKFTFILQKLAGSHGLRSTILLSRAVDNVTQWDDEMLSWYCSKLMVPKHI